MPEQVTSEQINSAKDPSVSAQWDESTPKDQQWKDLYSIIDSLKVGLLGTYRPSVGPVHRSMAIAKRHGPNILLLANAHQKKFSDLEHSKEVSFTFQDSKSQDWISVTGTASVGGPGNKDERVKEVWSKAGSAWFGDVGDGVHDGSANDPRMRVVEVKPTYISYWKAQVGTLGFAKEVVGAIATGGVPNPGVYRQFSEADIEAERKKSG